MGSGAFWSAMPPAQLALLSIGDDTAPAIV
jgi:hypothetical protein